jgi:paraquat-inducible protein B
MVRRDTGIGIIILAILIIAGAMYWFGFHTRGLEISIVFDKANGISKGSKLMDQGVPVGEVKKVQVIDGGRVAVSARIYKEYKDRINSSSVFIIEGANLGSKPDEKQITVEVLKDNAPPFSRGARVDGYSSRAQFFVRAGEKILEDVYEEFEKWLEEFQRCIREFSQDERLRKLKKDMQELMEEARKSAERGIKELRKEMPHLREELNRIIEDLRKLGRDSEANEFKEEFDRYLDRLVNRAREV